MPYVLLGIAVAVGLFLVVKGLRRTSPRNVARMAAAVAVLAGVGVIVFFAATGRLGWFGWTALLLPMFLRLGAIRRALRNLRGPTPGRSSDVETRYLRMELDHDSGVLQGTVIFSKHAGRTLDEMSLDELLDLLRECRVEDPRSAAILESYLDRVHGAARSASADGGTQAAAPDGAMTREQALEILGLEPGATEAEIREAHRRLLRANHPDRGGSTFIAAQINQAKDVLLGDRGRG